jgi:hypothetical protein
MFGPSGVVSFQNNTLSQSLTFPARLLLSTAVLLNDYVRALRLGCRWFASEEGSERFLRRRAATMAATEPNRIPPSSTTHSLALTTAEIMKSLLPTSLSVLVLTLARSTLARSVFQPDQVVLLPHQQVNAHGESSGSAGGGESYAGSSVIRVQVENATRLVDLLELAEVRSVALPRPRLACPSSLAGRVESSRLLSGELTSIFFSSHSIYSPIVWTSGRPPLPM